MRKKYTAPEFEISVQSIENIMDQSDTFIDVGDLFGE